MPETPCNTSRQFWSRTHPTMKPTTTFDIAGHWQGIPRLVFASHRAALVKSAPGFPFFSHPRFVTTYPSFLEVLTDPTIDCPP
jgi:hypothetical protein